MPLVSPPLNEWINAESSVRARYFLNPPEPKDRNNAYVSASLSIPLVQGAPMQSCRNHSPSLDSAKEASV